MTKHPKKPHETKEELDFSHLVTDVINQSKSRYPDKKLAMEVEQDVDLVAVPILLFIWFILAFVMDGNSYLNLRNKYDANYKERTLKEEHHEAAPAKGGKE